VSERAKVFVPANAAWADARKNRNFSLFAPHLERVLEFTRQYAACLRTEGQSDYEVLLQRYEGDLTLVELTGLLSGLREELVPFARQAVERAKTVDRPLSLSLAESPIRVESNEP
jgi:carboxypeptidase Taq